MINNAAIGKYKLINVLAPLQKLKILWHVEILTWKSRGNPNMCNILKMADRRAKRMKIWGLRSYALCYVATLYD